MKLYISISNLVNNKKGMVLVTALMFMVLIAMLSITAVTVTTTDTKIASNNRNSLSAFYVAEAGVEEARARLWANATSAIKISDTSPSDLHADVGWKVYIASDDASAAARGYTSADSKQSRVSRLSSSSSLNYVVEIKHQTSGGSVQYIETNYQRTTSGTRNIYLITSYGTASDGVSQRTIISEISPPIPISITSALYVNASTTVNSKNALINGNDICGGTVNYAGISSAQALGTISLNNSANAQGNPDKQGDQPLVDIQSMIDKMKGYANITTTGGTVSGVDYGAPTWSPSDCSVSNVVYCSGDLKLTGHGQGCGILLVDGDFEANGGFEWYGVIIVRGSATNYHGVGGSDGLAGAMLTGGLTLNANKLGGTTQINYCSTAIDDAFDNLPMQRLTWKESY